MKNGKTPDPNVIHPIPEKRFWRKGCYIPFSWRQEFGEQYLHYIQFICLAMTESYIENHFDEIIGYESEIETRLVDSNCTNAGLLEDNKRFINGFQNAGERVTLIDSDYEQAIRNLLVKKSIRKMIFSG